VLEHLSELDWVATLDEEAIRLPRWVILANPIETPMLPLLSRWLLPQEAVSAALYQTLSRMSLQEAFAQS
jgi:hypothetical protein